MTIYRGPGEHPVPPRRVAGYRPQERRVAAVAASGMGPGSEDVPRWLRTMAGVAWRLLVVVAAVALVFYATSQVTLLFIAVFLALVFTAVLRPAVDRLARVMPRFLAAALGLLLGLVVFAGMLTYVGFSVANQWNDLSSQFSTGISQIIDFLEHGPLPLTITNDQINSWISQGQAWVTQHSGQIASQAASSIGSVAEAFTALALAVFCSIFFLARGQDMWAWFLAQLPHRHRRPWRVAGAAGWYTFSGYTRGTVIVAVSDGLLAFILLSVIRVPLAAPLAVLVLLGAFIPLIGAPTAMVVAMIVALATGGVIKAAMVGIGIALIGQFEGHVLQPLVMGRQVALHPVVVALAVAGGTLTAGILGAVIAVPLVAVAWSVFSRLRPLEPELEEEDDPDDEPLVVHTDGPDGDGLAGSDGLEAGSDR